MNPSVHVRGLTKHYGTFEAVKGVDFEIFPGEVFGLLGPNGAGKTSTVEILEGLRPRNGGDVAVLGFDPARDNKLFARMANDGVAYDPTLSVLDAMRDLSAGRGDLLRRSLVQQAVSQKLLTGTAAALKRGTFTNAGRASGVDGAIRIAQENLRRSWQAGVPLVTGSDAGNMLVFHGPTVHRELQLWVEAGIPAPVALQAATLNAARLLRADARIGLVAAGRDANLLVVDGDPTRDISATERISMVVLKGERVRRVDLFDAAKNPLQ